MFSKFDRNINQNRTTVKRKKYLEELEIVEMAEYEDDDSGYKGEDGDNDALQDLRSGDEILRSLARHFLTNHGVLSDK